MKNSIVSLGEIVRDLISVILIGEESSQINREYYFEKHHNGALPMVVMVPKPDDDGECDPLCEAFDILDRWCNLDRDEGGKPGPRCPQYKGERK